MDPMNMLSVSGAPNGKRDELFWRSRSGLMLRRSESAQCVLLLIKSQGRWKQWQAKRIWNAISAERSAGGSYNSTFKTAQGAIASMQKEIAALSKTQSDITAYESSSCDWGKQKKLEVLQKQYDNIQKEMNENGQYSPALENKLLENNSRSTRRPRHSQPDGKSLI
jgi:hypothetical protein